MKWIISKALPKFTITTIPQSKYIKNIIISIMTPIKSFNNFDNIISPFKEERDVYNNTSMKMNMAFGSPFNGKLLII